MNFIDSLEQKTNVAHTENGALSNASTLNANLDFFSRAGAMRDNVEDAVELFKKAYIEDAQLAVKSLFYMRDIRGGQGERTLFRKCLHTLTPGHALTIAKHISEYGRWDDLFELDMIIVTNIVKEQFIADEKNMADKQPVSLMAKWLPSENTSSKETKERAIALIKALGLKPRQYRKKVSALRAHIKLVEQLMSANKWNIIDFSKVPSVAQKQYMGAFKRHNKERYEQYIEDVTSGKKTMNTSTLYTYDVYEALSKDKKVADAMWKSLPDYTNGQNALVVADVSGSMYGRPMSVSVSLALYFAERNKGAFNGYFMTFSETPQLQKVVGKTLDDKMTMIQNSDWGMNTNLELVFKTLLDTAVEKEASQDELPSTLYIISDMQFDRCIRTEDTNYNNAKKMFEDAGYKLPHVVFWNVNGRNSDAPATKYDKGVTLISGHSQNTFRYAMENKSPIELMEEILNSERYAPIVLD